MYGDLNCPFCFAMCMRIHSMGATRLVEWRGVQHLPMLPIPADRMQGKALEVLRDELERLSVTEPRLAVSNRYLRPNSGLATRIIAAVRRAAPDKEWRLTLALYRALWFDRRDISAGSTVSDIAASCGITLQTLPLADAFREALEWQSEWQSGPFNGRLPALRSERGATLLGLGTHERLKIFLASGLFSSRNWNEACLGAGAKALAE